VVADAITQSLKVIALGQRSPTNGRALHIDPVQAKSTAERLYDSLAEAKQLTAQVAMHLDSDLRRRLFAQLDDLLNLDDWHDDDTPLTGSSFSTFLRMILFVNPDRRPGLGLSNHGNLVAAWTVGGDRLTIECLPKDTVRWSLSCEIDGDRERAAGETQVVRLPDVLNSFKPQRWFARGSHSAAI